MDVLWSTPMLNPSPFNDVTHLATWCSENLHHPIMQPTMRCRPAPSCQGVKSNSMIFQITTSRPRWGWSMLAPAQHAKSPVENPHADAKNRGSCVACDTGHLSRCIQMQCNSSEHPGSAQPCASVHIRSCSDSSARRSKQEKRAETNRRFPPSLSARSVRPLTWDS